MPASMHCVSYNYSIIIYNAFLLLIYINSTFLWFVVLFIEEIFCFDQLIIYEYM